jgi:hypothetical protein
VYISTSDIQTFSASVLDERFKLADKSLKGTRSFHFIEPVNANTLNAHKLSSSEIDSTFHFESAGASSSHSSTPTMGNFTLSYKATHVYVYIKNVFFSQ